MNEDQEIIKRKNPRKNGVAIFTGVFTLVLENQEERNPTLTNEIIKDYVKEITDIEFKGHDLVAYQIHNDETNPHVHFQVSAWNNEKQKFDGWEFMPRAKLQQIKKTELKVIEELARKYNNLIVTDKTTDIERENGKNLTVQELKVQTKLSKKIEQLENRHQNELNYLTKKHDKELSKKDKEINSLRTENKELKTDLKTTKKLLEETKKFVTPKLISKDKEERHELLDQINQIENKQEPQTQTQEINNDIEIEREESKWKVMSMVQYEELKNKSISKDKTITNLNNKIFELEQDNKKALMDQSQKFENELNKERERAKQNSKQAVSLEQKWDDFENWLYQTDKLQILEEYEEYQNHKDREHSNLERNR